ncbi:SPOSA6832_05004, partial [Sporobolomyces salmonicolor]
FAEPLTAQRSFIGFVVVGSCSLRIVADWLNCNTNNCYGRCFQPYDALSISAVYFADHLCQLWGEERQGQSRQGGAAGRDHSDVQQLAASSQLAVSEPAALFALRVKDSGELVTEENLSRLLERGNHFTLGSSPTIEAVEMVDKLSSGEASVLKLATFSLRTLIKERAFLTEFITRGGLEALQEVIRRSSGNTLAYSLLSLQNLLELEESGWTGLQSGFIGRIVEIIATQPLINISRPATAILRRLASASQPSDTASAGPSSASTSTPGFSIVYKEISQKPDFLKNLVNRLSSNDTDSANLSLGLINGLLRGSTNLGDLRFSDELEELDVGQVVRKLLDANTGVDIPSILTFQANLVASLQLALRTRVDDPHYHFFDEIWRSSQLEDDDETLRWRKLGFQTEIPHPLATIRSSAADLPSLLRQSIKEQLSRPESRRCPISSVSSTVVYLLAEHFDFLHGVPQTLTVSSPFLFGFYDCHALVVHFFLRMWQDSGATQADFERVTTLTRSQVAFVLTGNADKTWAKIRQWFLNADYKTVRDRQMREMEIEDDVLSKAPVRSASSRCLWSSPRSLNHLIDSNLRGRLYLESYEFVRSQRISCLHEGAWFRVPSSGGGKKTPQQPKLWRFYRLAPNRKALHYAETTERVPIRSGLDDLPGRIDLALVTDVVSSSASAVQRSRHLSVHRSTSSITNARLSVFSKDSSGTATSLSPAPPPLSFALQSADGALAELVAPDQSTYSEWVDGLSLLRADGSIITTDTADYIQTLTDIGVKIKLLDLSGEKVEIPTNLRVDSVPRSTDFFYSDSM